MNTWSFIKNAFYVALGCFLLAVIMFFISFDVMEKHECSIVADSASNEKVINYLNKWANEHILDQGYYFVSGMGKISAKKGDEFVNITPLPDPNITNIELKYLRFQIYKKSANFEGPFTSQNVTSIEFGRNRNTIIILKNGELMKSYRGHDIESGHLIKVREDVYAYCANTRF